MPSINTNNKPMRAVSLNEAIDEGLVKEAPTIGNALKELEGNLAQLRIAINDLDDKSSVLRYVELQPVGQPEVDELETRHIHSLIQQHNRTLVALTSRLARITEEIMV